MLREENWVEVIELEVFTEVSVQIIMYRVVTVTSRGNLLPLSSGSKCDAECGDSKLLRNVLSYPFKIYTI
jgi:hypothetical protein